MYYRFELLKLREGARATYAVDFKTPSGIGGGGFFSIDEAAQDVIRMIAKDVTQARAEGVTLPETANVYAKVEYRGRTISDEEYKEFQHILEAGRQDGFPEFVFSDTPIYPKWA